MEVTSQAPKALCYPHGEAITSVLLAAYITVTRLIYILYCNISKVLNRVSPTVITGYYGDYPGMRSDSGLMALLILMWFNTPQSRDWV